MITKVNVTMDILEVAQTLASADTKKPATTDQELSEWQKRVDYYFEVMTNSLTDWQETDKELPFVGQEVLGFNKTWENDYTPDGICVCYILDDNTWFVAKWCGTHDEWHTRECAIKEEQYESIIEPPTHWRLKPLSPKE